MEAASENPVLDEDSRSVDSEQVFGQFSEAAFGSRKRRLLRHMKTQTSTKSSNKKMQVCPDMADENLQTSVDVAFVSSQTPIGTYCSTGTDSPSFLLLDKGVQAAGEKEVCDRMVEATVTAHSETAQTDEIIRDSAAVQCGSFFFYMRSVGVQMQKIAEVKAVQVDVRKATVATQSERKAFAKRSVQTQDERADVACSCQVEMVDEFTEPRTSHQALQKAVRQLHTRLSTQKELIKRLSAFFLEELTRVKTEVSKPLSELQTALSCKMSQDIEQQSARLREAMSAQLERLQIEREVLEAENLELGIRVELLQSEQAENYMLIREVESNLVAEIEEKAEAKMELVQAKEALSTLEKNLWSQKLSEIEASQKSIISAESEQLSLDLEVKLAQADIEILNQKRIISEKDNKLKENSEFIDSLYFQIQAATHDTEHVRLDSQVTAKYYQNEVATLQTQLQVARFELNQFQNGNRHLCEELENMKETQSEYSFKVSLLAQAKSKAEIALKSALSDMKNSEEEIAILRKTVARLQKQARELEEFVQQTKLAMHLTAPASEETFDTEIQIQRLESEKLELQTDLVDLRRAHEEVKDRLETSCENMRKLQEALEVQKVKNVSLNNILSLTKSALSESREQRDAAEEKTASLVEQVTAEKAQTWQLEKRLEDALASCKAQQVQVQALSLSFDVQRDQNLALTRLNDDLQGKNSAEMKLRVEAESLIKQLQNTVENKERRWMAEKEELVSLNEHISEKTDELQRELAELKDSYSRAVTAADATRVALTEANDRSSRLEEELQKTKCKLGETEVSSEALTQKLEHSETAHREALAQLQSATLLKQGLEERLAELETTGNRLKKENEDLHTATSELEKKLAEESEKLVSEGLHLEHRKLTFYNEKEKMEREIQNLRREVASHVQTISDLQTSESAAQVSVESLRRSLQETEAQRTTAEGQLRSQSDSRITLLAEKDSLESQLEAFRAEKRELSSQVEELTTENSRLANQLNIALSSLREKSDLSMEESRSLKREVESLRADLTSVNELLCLSRQSEERLLTKKDELTERLIWYQSEYEKASVLKKANLQLTERNISLTEELRLATELLRNQNLSENK